MNIQNLKEGDKVEVMFRRRKYNATVINNFPHRNMIHIHIKTCGWGLYKIHKLIPYDSRYFRNECKMPIKNRKPKRFRISILRWLNYLFGTKEGEIPNRFIRIVRHVLFPLEYFYEKQSGIRYDIFRNIYHIEGYEISAYDIPLIGEKPEKVKTANSSRLYRLMTYFAVTTLYMYSKDLKTTKDMTVDEFVVSIFQEINRVCEESKLIMNYELSHEQISRAIIVYLKSRYSPDSPRDTLPYEFKG